jgi:hypothetical protein
MAPQRAAAPPAVTVEDPRVIAAVEEYLRALEAGETPDRNALLARYPAIATALAECLDGLEFVQQADPRWQPPALEPLPDAPAVAPELSAAAPLGDYRILREVGRGGMGVVYEAEQLSLGRRVALKVLPFAATLDPKQLQRFKHEAQAAAQLHHTHIVPVYAVGCERGVHYYAMQFIDGQTLAGVIRELRQRAGLGQLPEEAGPGAEPPTGPYVPLAPAAPPAAEVSTQPAAALATERTGKSPAFFRTVAHWGVQAALALEHAHDQGVVHRDIKPANLLLDGRGQLWITDFGLAHCQSQASLTLSGDLVGTLRYMSPEQALAQRGLVDHRTDLYSLGVTLYEVLTLEPAFTGRDRQELLRQLAAEEPRPPRRLNPAVPAELETIVLKAMAKNPGERYATARELADDLERFLKDEPIRARRPTLLQRARKWARRHQPVVWSAAVSVVVVLLLAVVGLAISNALIRQEREEAHRQRDAADQARQEAIAYLKTTRRAIDQMLTRVANERLLQVPQMEQVRRELLEEALKLYQGLLEAKSDDPALRQETGLAYGRLGNVYQRLDQQAAAEQALGQAIAVLEELSAAGALDPDGRRDLSRFYMNLGWVLGQLGRHAEKENAHRQALAQAEELAAEFPDQPGYRNLLADTCIDLGNAWRASRPGDAEALYHRAISLSALANGNRHHLGRAHLALGELLTESGRLPEGEEAFRQARAVFGKLVSDRPGLWQSRNLLGEAHRHLGRVLAANGRLAEAEQAVRQAVDVQEKLRADYPTVPGYREALVTSYADLVHLLAVTGQRREGEEVYRKLVPLQPERAATCNRLAWLLATCPEPTFRDPPRAVALAQRAVKLEPRLAPYWRTLGAAHYRAGHGKDAVAALEEAMKLRKGGDGFDWFLLALAHGQLGEKDKARPWYDQAVQWMERNQPGHRELRRFRLEAEERLGLPSEPKPPAK